MQNNVTNLSDYESDDLAPGHALLYGQYEIERHLIDGGFGMTYLARDSLDRQVVIKECFPSAVCRRINGEVRPRKPGYQDQYQSVIRSFLKEALRMAKLDHPNIVKVHQVFQENNTAYIAMDYVDGMDLLTMLDMDPGRLTDARIEILLRDTLEALDYVHDLGMLHRDISPDNLLLDKKDKLTLIDFGAAREEAARQTRAISTVMSVKDGYSPHEFYYTDGTQRPSSDIYSVGATFYHLITGYAPPDCQKRVAALSSDEPDPYKPLAEGNWALASVFLEAIDRALSISQEARFQSAQEWIDALDNPETPNEDDPMPEAVSVVEDTPSLASAFTDAPKHKMGRGEIKAPREERATRTVEVELGPELSQKISTLVESTNVEVTQGGPTTRKDDEVDAIEEEGPPLLYDIFGQPIEDVEKWLNEQDKLSKRKNGSTGKTKRAAGAKKTKKADGNVSDGRTSDEDEAGFGLLRVFSKLTSIRNRSVIVVQN